MTLTEFLEARIREDERAAEYAAGFGDGRNAFENDNYGCLRVQPNRVLAECASKRRIVEDHAATAIAHSGQGHDKEPACRQCTDSVDSSRVTVEWDVAERVVAPCDTLRFLALPYADHPDYDEGWRP